ncbi:DUF58 domain-containing protein [Photobacterium makurazakiensis]|uniref:DUF58 domain-containing protein n=1 Tax=Photobacterium makurazakiensis TaxID=2910234 RepID=UPI003D112B86
MVSLLNASTSPIDSRIYSDYSRLVKLQNQVGGFSLLPQLKAGTALSGRHSSTFRGRGLNFEELRHYQRGDDIRNLDWKVTMRTGKPHVRSYTEEKDRSVIICVDQRSSMFFSSVSVMKSVVAAEIAALTAWRVLKDNDRVGFVICRHNGVHWSKAKRSQADTLFQLSQLADANQQLNVASRDCDDVSLSSITSLLGRLKCRNTTIIILSDWSGVTDDDIRHLKHLQRHNDVLGILISDPLESSLLSIKPNSRTKAQAQVLNQTQVAKPIQTDTQPNQLIPWVIGDGEYQLNLQSKQQIKRASHGLQQHQLLKKQQLIQLMAIQRLPMIELDTQGQHIEQFKRAVGGGL